MKRKVNLRLVTGDPNLVTKDEIYVEMAADGTITALKKRNDAGELVTIVDEHVDQYILEDSKTATVDLKTAAAGQTINVTPTSGKDAMEQVVISIVDTTPVDNG